MTFSENEHTELKKSTSELKEGIISIASILNKHNKGELYFGIKNDGTVIGQELSEKTLRDISQAISNHIEPRIYPEISEELSGNKKYVKVVFVDPTRLISLMEEPIKGWQMKISSSVQRNLNN